MAEIAQIEDVLEIHPLDEVGRDINEILLLKHEMIRTSNGITYSRAIRFGCVSIFFARFNGKDRSTFTVGIDMIKNEEFFQMSDDFIWDIYHPENTDDKDEDIVSLKELVRFIGCRGA